MSIVQCANHHGGDLSHADRYRRVLPVSLERLYENVLDWERLTHQHATCFAALDVRDWGGWGWRAVVTDTGGRRSVVELALDRRCRRWVVRTLDGHGAGAEIWTVALPLGPRRVEIRVDFFLPGMEAERRTRVGRACAGFYSRLYDGDLAMMVERQRQLDRRIDRAREAERTRVLGARDSLVLPVAFTLAGREFLLVEVEGRLRAFPARCPHQLGPLSAASPVGRVVTCPWHGDRFDVVSGDNLSGRACRLSHLPEVIVGDDAVVRVAATH